MTRVFARRSFAVVVLTSTLFLVAVPSASAGPLFSSPGIQDSQIDWIATARTWLGEILGLNYGFGVPKKPTQATENTEVVREIGRNGSCIDPLGNPLPDYLCTRNAWRPVNAKPKS